VYRYSAGAVIRRDDGHEVVFELAAYLGSDKTNNEAEYLSLIGGLEKAAELGIANLTVMGDSMLVVNQVNGKWKVKMPHLARLHRRVEALKENKANFSGRQGLVVCHVLRELNSEADALANTAITVGSQLGKGINVYEEGRNVEGAGGGGFSGGGGGGLNGALGGARSRVMYTSSSRGFSSRGVSPGASAGAARGGAGGGGYYPHSSRGMSVAVGGTKRPFPAATTAPVMGGVYASSPPPPQRPRTAAGGGGGGGGGDPTRHAPAAAAAAAVVDVIDLTGLDASPARGGDIGGVGGEGGGGGAGVFWSGGAGDSWPFASLTMASAIGRSCLQPPFVTTSAEARGGSMGAGAAAGAVGLPSRQQQQQQQRQHHHIHHQRPVAVQCAPTSTAAPSKPPTTHARPAAAAGATRWLPVLRGSVRWMARLFV
jgi:ribonuclease HI